MLVCVQFLFIQTYMIFFVESWSSNDSERCCRIYSVSLSFYVLAVGMSVQVIGNR
jgi:hypothetical protein